MAEPMGQYPGSLAISGVCPRCGLAHEREAAVVSAVLPLRQALRDAGQTVVLRHETASAGPASGGLVEHGTILAWITVPRVALLVLLVLGALVAWSGEPGATPLQLEPLDSIIWRHVRLFLLIVTLLAGALLSVRMLRGSSRCLTCVQYCPSLKQCYVAVIRPTCVTPGLQDLLVDREIREHYRGRPSVPCFLGAEGKTLQLRPRTPLYCQLGGNDGASSADGRAVWKLLTTAYLLFVVYLLYHAAVLAVFPVSSSVEIANRLTLALLGMAVLVWLTRKARENFPEQPLDRDPSLWGFMSVHFSAIRLGDVLVRNKRFLLDGVLLSAAMFSLMLLFQLLLGGYELRAYPLVDGNEQIDKVVTVLLPVLALEVVDEFAWRGIVLDSLLRMSRSPISAILVCSILEAGLTGVPVSGATPVSFLFVVMFCSMKCIVYYSFRTIWFGAGLDWAWHVLRIAAFGAYAYLDRSAPVLLVDDGVRSTLLTGGSNGLEGSLVSVILLAVFLTLSCLVLAVPRARRAWAQSKKLRMAGEG